MMTRKTGTQAAAAGMLAVSVLVICLLAGWGLGVLLGAEVPLLFVGLCFGFVLGFWVVRKRFEDI